MGKSYAVRSALKNLLCASLSLHATMPLAQWLSQLAKPKKLPLWAEATLEQVKRGEAVDTRNFISALGLSLAGLAPFVLHLEDIHEANPDRLALLRDLAQTLQKLRGVGLLVTSRQEFSEPFKAVKLGPLSKESSDKLLEGELAATLPGEALEFIYSKAAGNPLFTLEYLRFLARQGNLWNDGKMWHWRKPEQERMPVVVEALLEQKIDGAKRDDMQRYVLESRAVLLHEAAPELWQKVARVNETELSTTVQALSQQGIFSEGDFAHPLFREVTLKLLAPGRKQHLSRRAISALEDDSVRAARFVEDANLEKADALALLTRAAEQARPTDKRLAGKLLYEAVHFAEGAVKGKLALETAQQLVDVHSELAHELAGIAATVPEFYQRATLLKSELLAEQTQIEAAVQLLDGLNLNAFDKVNHLVRIYALAQDTHKVYELIQQHPGILEKADTFTTIRYARALMHNGFRSETEQILQKALSSENVSPVERARFLQIQALLEGSYGDSKVMARLLGEAITLLEGSDELSLKQTLLFNRALALADVDCYDENKQCLSESMEVCLLLGDTASYMVIKVYLAKQLHLEGQYEQAEHMFLESLTFFQPKGVSFNLRFTLDFLAQLYLDWQTPHAKTLALKYANLSVDCATQLGRSIGKADSLTTLSFAELLVGQANKALATAREATAIYEEFHPEAAYQSLCAEAQILRALNDQTSRAALEEAATKTRQYGSGYQAHCIALELAHLNNDLAGAKEHMQWFEERGLLNGVNLARRYFPELTEQPEETSPSEKVARVEVLGPLQLSHNGKVEKLRGQKRQELLALLIEARLTGRSEVTRLELFDTLYPEEDEVKAGNGLKNLVMTLRELLGNTSLTTTSNGYALGDIRTDVEDFLETGDTRLWRGCYLGELGLEGNDTLRESLYLTLFEKAKKLLETDPKETARLGKMLLEYDPYQQAYLKLCLQALKSADNYKGLNRLYSESQQVFTEVGEHLPKTWQNFLST
jgi:hypothetical protein